MGLSCHRGTAWQPLSTKLALPRPLHAQRWAGRLIDTYAYANPHIRTSTPVLHSLTLIHSLIRYLAGARPHQRATAGDGGGWCKQGRGGRWYAPLHPAPEARPLP